MPFILSPVLPAVSDGVHSFVNIGTLISNGGTFSSGANGVATLTAGAGAGGISTIYANDITLTGTAVSLNHVAPITALPTFTTWANQAGATETFVGNGPNIYQTFQASASCTLRYKALAAGAFTLTANLSYQPNSISAPSAGGLGLTDGTKIVTFAMQSVSGGMSAQVAEFSNPTTFVATPAQLNISQSNNFWLRIIYDGVSTWTFSYSYDNFIWVPLYTTASLYIPAPTGVGVLLYTQTSNTVQGTEIALNYWNGA